MPILVLSRTSNAIATFIIDVERGVSEDDNNNDEEDGCHLPIQRSERQSKDRTGGSAGLKGETAGFSNAFCNTTLPFASYILLYFDTETAPRMSLSHHASSRNTALPKKTSALLRWWESTSHPDNTRAATTLVWPCPYSAELARPSSWIIPGSSTSAYATAALCSLLLPRGAPKAWHTQTGSRFLRCSPRPVSAMGVHGQPGLELPKHVAILKQPRD